MLFRRRCYRTNFRQGQITIDEMKNKIKQGAIIIDVRSKQEYNEGHLQGAINIPEYEITRRVQNEIPKKNQLIVIYCEYGTRSRNTYIRMRQMGYTNVYSLYGGLESLQNI